MPDSVTDLLRRWEATAATATTGEPFNQLHKRLTFLSDTHYRQYIPTFGPDYLDYESRLEYWLANVADDVDKQLLFELAHAITFFTREDFLKLHQSALSGPITRTIIDQLGLQLDDPALSHKVSAEIHHHSWFCALTDSMQIAEFCHANKLQGTEFRPDWQSLACFGDADRIRRFLTHNPDGTARTFPLRRIVILEDFIGSGGMMLRPVRSGGIGASGSIDFAASIDSSLPVIVVPLLVCPEGSKRGFALEGRYPNVSFRPVMELPVSEFVTSASVHEAGSLDARIQTLLPAIAALVKGTGDRAPFYGIYGFQETGAKVVMYSNCPANSLPAIHYPSISWNPLFPRAARIL